MKLWSTATAVVAGLVLAAGSAHADVFDLVSDLSGANEVPPNQSEATGAAVMSYDDNTNLYFLEIVVTGINLADVIGTHIHLAPPGQNGAVIENLLAKASWTQDGDDIRLTIVDGMFPEANEIDLLTGGTYINIHTIAFPAGEIRGQLVLDGGGPGCDGPDFEGTINEIRIDQPGTDNDEYFEIVGEPGSSLDGVFYIVIGDGPGGSGTVESITDLSGLCIPDSGRFLVAETTFTLNGATPDLVLTGNGLNFENSDNVTHMLVRNLNPAMTINVADIDVDDDGMIDPTGDYDGDSIDDGPPWDAILDDVALLATVGSGDLVYSLNTVGPDGSFVPGHVYRCPDGVGDWQIGAFDPATGQDTPGESNECETGGEFATLVDYTVIFGTYLSGGLPEIEASDDQYLSVRSRFGFTALEPNFAELRIDADSAVASPMNVDLLFEDRSNTPNTVATVRVRNQTTAGLNVVGTYPVGWNTDNINMFDDLDGTLYVGASGEIEVRVRYVAVSVFTALGFTARLDQFTIFVD